MSADGDERHEASVRHPAASGRRAGRSRTRSRRACRVDPSSARRRSRSAGRRCCGGCCCCCCGACGRRCCACGRRRGEEGRGKPAAAAAPAEGRRQEVVKVTGRPCAGRISSSVISDEPDDSLVSFPSDLQRVLTPCLALLSKSSSVSAIPGPSTCSRVTTRASGSSMRSRQSSAGDFAATTNFRARSAASQLGGLEVTLLKPTTYMNRSGLAIRALADYLKYRPARSWSCTTSWICRSAKCVSSSAAATAGTTACATRSRISARISGACESASVIRATSREVIDYVLRRAPKEEEDRFSPSIEEALEALPVFIEQGAERAMNGLHAEEAVSGCVAISQRLVATPHQWLSTPIHSDYSLVTNR